MKNFRTFYLNITLFVFLLIPVNVFGLPGALDTTFSSDGIVQSGVNAASALQLFCRGDESINIGYNQAIQKNDGKIVVASANNNGDVSVQRFHSTGKPDLTFGTSGSVVTDVPDIFMRINAVAVLSDGKIVVVGGSSHKVVLIRYNSNGVRDTSFDGDGIAVKTIADFGAGYLYFLAVAMTVQPDGKILVAGSLTKNFLPFSDNKGYFALMRFNSGGTLDASFDFDGLVEDELYTGSDFSGVVTAIHYQASPPRIIASGLQCAEGAANTIVGKYFLNGSPDTSFTRSGWTGLISTVSGESHSSLVESDGKIVVAGDWYLERINPNGSPDTSFGVSGRVYNGYFTMFSLRRDAGGRYIVAGVRTGDAEKNPVLQRYNPNGTLDTSFGFGGMVITDVGIPMDITRLNLQSDGKIVLGGVSNRRFTLFRYLAD